MDLIETLDELINITKGLLEICNEQAKVIEMAGLICRREEIEEFEKALRSIQNV